jgi:hypothetical protein
LTILKASSILKSEMKRGTEIILNVEPGKSLLIVAFVVPLIIGIIKFPNVKFKVSFMSFEIYWYTFNSCFENPLPLTTF